MYSTPLGPIVQGAIGRSADEAGMTASSSSETDYKPSIKNTTEYVLASKIRRCWAKKAPGPSSQYGPGLADDGGFRAGRFDLQAAVQRAVLDREHQRYLRRSAGGVVRLGSEDEAGIYDEPGEVLSVALKPGIQYIPLDAAKRDASRRYFAGRSNDVYDVVRWHR